MNSDTQLKVMAYLDNELSPGEARKIAALISADREAQELFQELRAARDFLAGNEQPVKLNESRDFYWSKIQREIRRVEREPAAAAPSAWWLRLVAPVAGTAALIALVVSAMNPAGPQMATARTDAPLTNSRPLHGEVEDLAPDVSSVTFRSEQDGVTVVWLTARD